MRFYRPEVAATRIKGGWCIFPKTINGETRWLEWAEWEEQYRSYGYEWSAVRWIA